MTFPNVPINDFDTSVNKVRALIPDIEKVQNPNRPGSDPETMFTDEHIKAFLDTAGGSIIGAAAWACDTIGMSEAIIAKVITTEDLSTDGAKLMNAMQARATRLFAKADREEEAAADSFTIVPFFLDHYEAH